MLPDDLWENSFKEAFWSLMSYTWLRCIVIIFGVLVLLSIFIIIYYIVMCIRTRMKIRALTNQSAEISPDEFMKMRRWKSGQHPIISEYDCPGVYIFLNKTKNLYYVGQSVKVLRLITQHFTGRGNVDVYADWKNGDQLVIRVIKFQGSGFYNLNELERNTILKYNAFSKAYHRNRGNRY